MQDTSPRSPPQGVGNCPCARSVSASTVRLTWDRLSGVLESYVVYVRVIFYAA